MSTYTNYYNLDKYEGSDRPNLRDQYNAAMDKIDEELHDQAQSQSTDHALVTALQGTVANLNNTVTNQGVTIVNHGARLNTVESDVSTLQSTTTSQGQDIDTLEERVGGVHFYHIQNDQRGSAWNAGTWSSKACSFNAFIVYDEVTGHGMLIGEFFAQSNATTSPNPWQGLDVVTLSDWTADSQEGHLDYCACEVINNDWGAGQSVAQMAGNRITWTPVNVGSTTLDAEEAITAVVVFPVTRRV